MHAITIILLLFEMHVPSLLYSTLDILARALEDYKRISVAC
jgi:hypothetical protein